MIKLDRRLILNFDWTLFILVLIISVIGLLNIYSSGFSLTDSRLTPLYIRQIQWILVGIAGMAVAFLVDYRFFSRHAYLIYGISIALLLLVFTSGYATRGSQRWIAVGGFTFQPSEMVKLTIILALAKYFDRSQIGRNYRLRELLIPFLIVLIPFLLIIRQPDLGTGLIIIILFFSIVFFVGLDWRSFLLAAAGGLTLTPIGWHLLKDYKKESQADKDLRKAVYSPQAPPKRPPQMAPAAPRRPIESPRSADPENKDPGATKTKPASTTPEVEDETAMTQRTG